MPEMNSQLTAALGERVRVFIPNEVAFDLNKMNKITADVLKKLGCGGCHSGRILDFVSLQHFVVNPKSLDVQEMHGPQGL